MMSAVLVAGCSSGSPPSAASSALQRLVGRAHKALATLSYHAEVAERTASGDIQVQLNVGTGGLRYQAATTSGTALIRGWSLRFVASGSHIYLRAPETYWQAESQQMAGRPLSDSAARRIRGKWVQLADNGPLFEDVEPLTDKSTLVLDALGAIRDTSAYRRLSPQQDDNAHDVAYVDSAQHLTISFARSTSRLISIVSSRGVLRLSRYGRVPPAHRPPAKRTVAGAAIGC